MTEFVELSNSMGMPDLAYSVLAAVETTKATTLAIAGEAAHNDTATGSSRSIECYIEATQLLVEMDILRVITDKDQAALFNEIHRTDVYTYASLYGVDIPPLGALDFTQRGAQLWMSMLTVSASRYPLFGPGVIHSCHRFSQSTGRVLKLLLADNSADLASENVNATCRINTNDYCRNSRVLYDGCANTKWRYYWWSRPMMCWYRMTLFDVNPTVHWPRQDSLHHGYQDLDRFSRIMGMDWRLPDIVYDTDR